MDEAAGQLRPGSEARRPAGGPEPRAAQRRRLPGRRLRVVERPRRRLRRGVALAAVHRRDGRADPQPHRLRRPAPTRRARAPSHDRLRDGRRRPRHGRRGLGLAVRARDGRPRRVARAPDLAPGPSRLGRAVEHDADQPDEHQRVRDGHHCAGRRRPAWQARRDPAAVRRPARRLPRHQARRHHPAGDRRRQQPDLGGPDSASARASARSTRA